MVDAATKKALSGIPLLKTKAGPRDKELWVTRLKEFILFWFIENALNRYKIDRGGGRLC